MRYGLWELRYLSSKEGRHGEWFKWWLKDPSRDVYRDGGSVEWRVGPFVLTRWIS